MNGGTTTFGDYYSALVSKVGTDVATADSRYETQTDVVETYQNLRDSVSSVSLDEETTKLLMYQSAYTAAAKVMTALDDMMDTLLSM